MDQHPPAPSAVCPCGSGRRYGDCCQPVHQGALAVSAEALMRSRFCAYRLGLATPVLNTWHPSSRPSALDLADGPNWVALAVLAAAEAGDRGRVHFRAVHRSGDRWGFLEERADFLREAGCWYYLGGEVAEGQVKPGRNDACPCGSGQKLKKCCGR